MKKIIIILVVVAVVGFGLLQLVPYGRDHTNPPVVSEIQWDSSQTRQLAVDACYACHSNETEWPWYSNIAPASWLIYRDVVSGRRHLNFSDWGSRPRDKGEIIEVVQSGEMPPFQYWIAHPKAHLTDQQRADFVKGLEATIK